jgi:hypothetical protein
MDRSTRVLANIDTAHVSIILHGFGNYVSDGLP